MHSTVPGVIGVYDLADLAASLAPGKLLITDVTDGAGNPSVNEEFMRELEIIRSAYKKSNAGSELHIIVNSNERLNDLYLEWIK